MESNRNLTNLIESINDNNDSLQTLISTVQSEKLISEASKENIKNWLEDSFSSIIEDEQTPRTLILNLLIEKKFDELNDRFFEKIQPGTAGMRGKLGIGSTRINEATVGMFAEAHARYLQENPENFREGIILGGDSRKGSYDKKSEGPGYLQKMSALIYAEKGIPVYLCDKPMPTPLVSFAISEVLINNKLPLSAAINTASHNPASDNGFKIYESKGHQVVSADFKNGIEKHINSISSFTDVHTAKLKDNWPDFYPAETPETPIIKELKTEKASIFILNSAYLIKEYVNSIAKVRTLSDKNIAKTNSCHFTNSLLQSLAKEKLVITTLNGNGWQAVKALLESHGLIENTHFFSVQEENIPDGSFPVGYGSIKGKPNPEYRENFYKAISVALKNKAKYVIAADPDSDRIGIGIVDLNSKSLDEAYNNTRFLNGNEQLSITLAFLGALESFNKNDLVIQTRVSSRLYEKIAEEIGISIFHVLVGFKYFGQISNCFVENLISKLKTEDNAFNRIAYSKLDYYQRKELYRKHSLPRFVHGGEESMGQNMYDFVFDKDTPATVASFAEILGFLSLGNEEKSEIFTKLAPVYLKDDNKLPEILMQSTSVEELLTLLQNKFGCHKEYLHAVKFEGEKGNKLKNQVMEYFRTTSVKVFNEEDIFSPLKCLAKADYLISNNQERTIEYLDEGSKNLVNVNPYSFPWFEGDSSKPLDSSDYLTFFLENNSEVHIRPSGTEPMVKIYLNFQGKELSEVNDNIEAVLKSIMNKVNSFS